MNRSALSGGTRCTMTEEALEPRTSSRVGRIRGRRFHEILSRGSLRVRETADATPPRPVGLASKREGLRGKAAIGLNAFAGRRQVDREPLISTCQFPTGVEDGMLDREIH